MTAIAGCDNQKKHYFSISCITAGFVAVLVGYSSSAIIVYQAAMAAGASAAEASSWLWALGIGMGLSSIGLSLYYKVPILTAWSTPGAALLVTSLSGIPLSDAIGIFVICALLVVLCGMTGVFAKLMRLIPLPLASAMLAGVLVSFGLNIFVAFDSSPWLVASMLISYFIVKAIKPGLAVPAVLLVAIGYCAWFGEMAMSQLQLNMAAPVWTTATFNVQSIIGVGLPLFLITMASQNMPGIAVLKGHQFDAPASPLITTTGITGLLLAPFGGFMFNLSAITAAICMSKDVCADKSQRYWATVWGGVFYIITGLLGATVVSLIGAFPMELVTALAGIALLGVIASSLSSALSEKDQLEAPVMTFLMAASGLTFFGISSAFWGLCVGLLVYRVNARRKLG